MSELRKIIPEEILKVKAWCLSKKQWDNYNFMDSIISLAQKGQKIDNIRKIRLEGLLREYQVEEKRKKIKTLFV